MNAEKTGTPPGERKQRILVVDDDPTTLKVAVALLERNGFDARPLQDSTRIFAHVAELRPDLVIMDYDMPGLSGPQASYLLNCVPAPQRIPIVFLSGHIDGNARLAGALNGAAAYLDKPINEFALVRIIRLILGKPKTCGQVPTRPPVVAVGAGTRSGVAV